MPKNGWIVLPFDSRRISSIHTRSKFVYKPSPKCDYEQNRKLNVTKGNTPMPLALMDTISSFIDLNHTHLKPLKELFFV